MIPHLHTTKVCPVLHHLCNVCGLRGHDSGCQMTHIWISDVLKAFEQVADQGLYTCRRFEEPEWGFFQRGRPAHIDILPDYRHLLAMDPMAAYNFSRLECPQRIMQEYLWGPQYGPHLSFKRNRPERYNLKPRID